jgi:FkbM family methyltransferase
MNIPILIICYDNYKYVQNTVLQLLNINKELHDTIQIVDNCSTDPDTIQYLKDTSIKVIYNTSNKGPSIDPYNNVHIYDTLPDKFILTDPDLQFNKSMPANFIQILSELSDIYSTFKIGFALDISDFNQMYQTTYHTGKNIYEWESPFWSNRIDNTEYELYNAAIDTTFCLINKKFNEGFCVRVAGIFTAKHIPWYKNNNLYSTYELYTMYKNTLCSTIKKCLYTYINTTYIMINKNNEIIFIENNQSNPNLHFWKHVFSTWENNTFSIFDTFLDINKIFIDIGGWIGTTGIYGSRKSKHVYSIEADTHSYKDMCLNFQNNCKNNYTLINRAIYNIDDIDIKFGKNKYLQNSKMNDSTSQIYDINDTSDQVCSVKTITLQSILDLYSIDPSKISLIKVDIEGGEENILHDLYAIYKQYRVPLYISFHYSWWKDMNLNRFEFLTEDQKNSILANHFISILFN